MSKGNRENHEGLDQLRIIILPVNGVTLTDKGLVWKLPGSALGTTAFPLEDGEVCVISSPQAEDDMQSAPARPSRQPNKGAPDISPKGLGGSAAASASQGPSASQEIGAPAVACPFKFNALGQVQSCEELSYQDFTQVIRIRFVKLVDVSDPKSYSVRKFLETMHAALPSTGNSQIIKVTPGSYEHRCMPHVLSYLDISPCLSEKGPPTFKDVFGTRCPPIIAGKKETQQQKPSRPPKGALKKDPSAPPSGPPSGPPAVGPRRNSSPSSGPHSLAPSGPPSGLSASGHQHSSGPPLGPHSLAPSDPHSDARKAARPQKSSVPQKHPSQIPSMLEKGSSALVRSAKPSGSLAPAPPQLSDPFSGPPAFGLQQNSALPSDAHSLAPSTASEKEEEHVIDLVSSDDDECCSSIPAAQAVPNPPAMLNSRPRTSPRPSGINNQRSASRPRRSNRQKQPCSNMGVQELGSQVEVQLLGSYVEVQELDEERMDNGSRSTCLGKRNFDQATVTVDCGDAPKDPSPPCSRRRLDQATATVDGGGGPKELPSPFSRPVPDFVFSITSTSSLPISPRAGQVPGPDSSVTSPSPSLPSSPLAGQVPDFVSYITSPPSLPTSSRPGPVPGLASSLTFTLPLPTSSQPSPVPDPDSCLSSPYPPWLKDSLSIPMAKAAATSQSHSPSPCFAAGGVIGCRGGGCAHASAHHSQPPLPSQARLSAAPVIGSPRESHCPALCSAGGGVLGGGSGAGRVGGSGGGGGVRGFGGGGVDGVSGGSDSDYQSQPPLTCQDHRRLECDSACQSQPPPPCQAHVSAARGSTSLPKPSLPSAGHQSTGDEPWLTDTYHDPTIPHPQTKPPCIPSPTVPTPIFQQANPLSKPSLLSGSPRRRSRLSLPKSEQSGSLSQPRPCSEPDGLGVSQRQAKSLVERTEAIIINQLEQKLPEVLNVEGDACNQQQQEQPGLLEADVSVASQEKQQQRGICRAEVDSFKQQQQDQEPWAEEPGQSDVPSRSVGHQRPVMEELCGPDAPSGDGDTAISVRTRQHDPAVQEPCETNAPSGSGETTVGVQTWQQGSDTRKPSRRDVPSGSGRQSNNGQVSEERKAPGADELGGSEGHQVPERRKAPGTDELGGSEEKSKTQQGPERLCTHPYEALAAPGDMKMTQIAAKLMAEVFKRLLRDKKLEGYFVPKWSTSKGRDTLCCKRLHDMHPDVHQALASGDEEEVRSRTRVVYLDDPCHPCHANPWVKGQVDFDDLQKALQYNRAYGVEEEPLLAIYFLDVKSAQQDEQYASADVTGKRGLSHNYTFTYKFCEEVVVVGDQSRCLATCVNAVTSWTSPNNAGCMQEGLSSTHNKLSASDGGPSSPSPPGSPEACSQQLETYVCKHDPCNCARYRLRQANIDIVHLVHKSGLTITPVIAFLKKKGVAVQPGDEAIGDWAGDSTFFEIVASNYKQYKAYKELEDEKQRLQDENKRLEEDNQKLRKDKEAEIQRLRDENLGFKGLEEEVQRLRAEVQQAQKDKEENQRLVLKGALSQKLASASTHAVTCRQHIPQARSQLRTPNMSSKSMGLHAPIHPMTGGRQTQKDWLR